MNSVMISFVKATSEFVFHFTLPQVDDILFNTNVYFFNFKNLTYHPTGVFSKAITLAE